MARAPANPAAKPARRKPATRPRSKPAAKPGLAAETAPKPESPIEPAALTAPVVPQTPPPAPPVQTPPARRFRFSLPSLDSGATLLRKVILNIVFVLAVVLFIAVMIGQFLHEQVIIEPIAVPKALANQGMTAEVVSRRLWDGLRDAQVQAGTSKSTLSAIPDSQRLQFAVPDVGLSLDSVVRQTRQFFNLHQMRVSGEIVCRTAECSPGDVQLRLRIIKGTNEVVDLPPMAGIDQRAYFTNAAVQVLTVLDPFVAIAAISDAQPVRAAALARRLVRQRHPDAKWAHNLLGNLHRNAGDYDRALTEYRAALALDPEFLTARINLSISLRQSGALDEAAVLLTDLLVLYPDNALVVESQAELVKAQGDTDGAIALLEQSARLDPTNPKFFSRIGQIEDERGQLAAAADWYKKALAIDPAYPLAIEPMFLRLAGGGDLEGAEAMMAAAARYRPTDALVQGLHAVALSFLGRPEEALAAYDRGLAMTPDDFDMLYRSSRLLEELSRVPESIERLNRAIALRPYDPAARFGRGAAYAYIDQNDLARIDLERVLELDTSGTQYGSLAKSFLEILDGLDEAKAEEAAAEASEAQP